MSILHYTLNRGNESQELCLDADVERYQRDALGDLKHGLDLVFELKSKLEILHPLAYETLLRLLSY